MDEVEALDRFWPAVTEELQDYLSRKDSLQSVPNVSAKEIRDHLEQHFSFENPVPAEDLVHELGRMMREWTVHTPHSRYFGLFNPDVFPASIAGDTLVAGFNPQLAAWSHAPASNEIEAHTLRFIERLIGYPESESARTFTSGGMEANHSAVLVALTDAFSDFTKDGVRSCSGAPRLYVSAEAHHSFIKIAHACGLGRGAVVEVPVTVELKLDMSALKRLVNEDRQNGYAPFLIVATAGTTAAGAIDPIDAMADFAASEGLWLHVDAAWGGGALFSPRLRPHLDGIDRSDSVTFDAHKWLSVPMGAGMFFCRHREANRTTFGIQTSYMPKAADSPDPYVNTLQWSRRSIGTKVFAALASLGRDGYRKVIEHQAAMGDLMRVRFAEEGWEVVNPTPLPLVCIQHPSLKSEMDYRRVLDKIYQEGNVWISVSQLAHFGPVFRACITNYRTGVDDVEALIASLTKAMTS